jgi:hypothetical protein
MQMERLARLSYHRLCLISAKEGKFKCELALACELEGYFYKEQGEERKAIVLFKQSRDAYIGI